MRPCSRQNEPGVEPIAACGSTWKGLIAYSKQLIGHNLQRNEKGVVISDNFQKPKNEPLYFERAIVAGCRPGPKYGEVLNAAMMESAASVLLQLVDVLLGCVIFDFKAGSASAPNAAKKALADRLRTGYRTNTFAKNQTLKKPNYFSVWILKPQNPILPSGK